MMRVRDYELLARECARLRELVFAQAELLNALRDRVYAGYDLAEIHAAGEEKTQALYEAIVAAVETATNEHCLAAGHDPIENVSELRKALTNQRKLLERYEPACALLVEFCAAQGMTEGTHEALAAWLIEQAARALRGP